MPHPPIILLTKGCISLPANGRFSFRLRRPDAGVKVTSAEEVKRALQSPDAQDAMLKAFDASPEEIGQAAVALAADQNVQRKTR